MCDLLQDKTRIKAIRRRALLLTVAIIVAALLAGLFIWSLQTSYSDFEPGRTRQQYVEEFGDPVWVGHTDDDSFAGSKAGNGCEVWGYETREGYVFIIFSANSPRSIDLVRTTKEIEKLLGPSLRTTRH